MDDHAAHETPTFRHRRVLLGTAGTGTSWGLLASLRDLAPDAYVVATDMAPAHLIAASALSDVFEQVPAVADEEFEPRLLELFQQHQIDTYVPTHDPEIIVAGRLRHAGLLDGIVCSAAPCWAGELCWDKLALGAWLMENGFPTPETVAAVDIDSPEAGWMVKPRRGVGSIGVERVESADDLASVRRRSNIADAIAQRLLAGPEVTVDAFLGRDGTSAALCRERVEVKSGVCTKARLFRDHQIEDLVLELGRRLALHGAFCAQLMVDSRGARLLTDVNPRPGAGTRLSAAVGFNVHAAMLADLWGDDPRPHLRPLNRERWVVRQYREIVLV
jgi:carbamoyl-phosphate synthase large subunit